MQYSGRRIVLIALLVVALNMMWGGAAAAQTEVTVVINEVQAVPIASEAAYDITAYVTIVDGNEQPITTLSPADFTVSHDGTPVELKSAALSERPASIMLAVDNSLSMQGGKMESAKDAATRFIDKLSDQDRVGIIYFSNEVETPQPLSDDLAAAKSIVGFIEADANGTGTCLYDAVYKAVSIATGAPSGQRAVVLLTDGFDEMLNQAGPCSEQSIDDVIALATSETTQVPVYAIGIEPRVNNADLERIASETGGVSLFAPSADDIAALFETVALQLKSQYALTYRSATTSGEHSLTVTVTTGGVTEAQTRSFAVPELPPVLSLSGLDQGAILEGSRTVRATVSGNREIASVAFRLDGESYLEVNSAPFEVTLDPDSLEPGVHELVAAATLADGTGIEGSLEFAVQAAGATGEGISAGAGGEAGGGVLASLPGWVVPTGAAGGFLFLLLVVVLVVVGVRRARRGVGDGRGPQPAMPVYYVSGEGQRGVGQVGATLATLTVQESLSLRGGQPFDLTREEVRLGRGVDNDVVIPDAPVSRHHAKIQQRDEGVFWVTDLSSTYGTFVNDEHVGLEGLPMRDGDILRLGTRTRLAFSVPISPPSGPEDRTIDFSFDGDTLESKASEVRDVQADVGAAEGDVEGRDETLPIQKSDVEPAPDSGDETLSAKPRHQDTRPAAPLAPPKADETQPIEGGAADDSEMEGEGGDGEGEDFQTLSLG